MKLAIATAVLVACVSGRANQGAQLRTSTTVAPLSVTICQLSESPAKFADKVVVVHAYVIGGIPHGMVLWDPNCPKGGVAINYSRGSAVRELDDAIFHHGFPQAGTDKVVFGDFTGKFSWQPKSQHHQRLLFITRAERVAVIDNPMPPLF